MLELQTTQILEQKTNPIDPTPQGQNIKTNIINNQKTQPKIIMPTPTPNLTPSSN